MASLWADQLSKTRRFSSATIRGPGRLSAAWLPPPFPPTLNDKVIFPPTWEHSYSLPLTELPPLQPPAMRRSTSPIRTAILFRREWGRSSAPAIVAPLPATLFPPTRLTLQPPRYCSVIRLLRPPGQLTTFHVLAMKATSRTNSTSAWIID